MEIWPASHGSLHLNQLHAISPVPTPSFPQLPSQSSPTLSLEPLLPSPSLKNTYPGLLSLHNYRKFLSQDGDSPTSESQEGKTLRRKNAASNLHHQTTQMGSTYYFPNHPYHHHHAYPFSVSSTASSPAPPLSPSYSPSALSEQLPEILDGFGFPLSPPLDSNYYEKAASDRQSPYKLLDTFRDRLEKFPDPDPSDVISIPGHNRARSDSALFKARRARKPPAPTTTVIHQGTSFEILNPHDSLHFARIVSYIEDVDSQSAPSNHQRDSYLTMSSSDPLIIHHEASTTDPPTATWDDIPPGIPTTGYDQKAHDELVGDSPHHPMPSISERLEEKDVESCYSPSLRPLSRPLSRHLSMIRPWTAQNESDLGEPGPPVCDDDIPLPYYSSSREGGELNPAMYDIGHLPEPGKGITHPTTIIYSQHKPLRKRSTVTRKKRKTASSSYSSSSPSAAVTATLSGISGPLGRLRGIANALRRKTFPPRGGGGGGGGGVTSLS